MSVPRFLVTGALGCIGAWTCRRLVRAGAGVVAMDLGSSLRRLEQLMAPDELRRVTLVQGDISDLRAVESVIDDHRITSVIHLAALQIPSCRADPVLGAKVNVLGTVNVFEAVRRRTDRIGPIAYTSSIGMYAPSDVEQATGRLALGAHPHPTTHYGVYKLANEGTARAYWEESSVASVGLRPLTVYGVGRDQGMTSGPTKAMASAVLGVPYNLPFGGPTLYQYADDVAAALVAASQSALGGALVYNLGGEVVDSRRVVEEIEAAVPDATGLITFDPGDLPLPSIIDTAGIEDLGLPPPTPFDEGVRATVAIFRDLHAGGRLDPSQQGLETAPTRSVASQRSA